MWAEKQTVPIFCLKPPRPHPERRRTAKLIFKPLQCTCPFLLLCRSFPSQQRPNLLSPAGSSLFDTILYDKSLCQLDLGRKKKKKGSPSGIALSGVHSETLRDPVTMDQRHLSRESSTLQSPHLCQKWTWLFSPFSPGFSPLSCIFNWIKNDLPRRVDWSPGCLAL